MKTSLTGKIALITGGASGIGKLVSFGLGKLGCRIIAWDINSESLETFSREAKALGIDVTTMVCDVSRRGDIYLNANLILKDFGKVDILVNNAGIVSGKTLLETSDEKIEKTFAVNTLASFWTVKAFLPKMIERNAGHIVTISSASGLIGVKGLADYSASKFAVFGFHEALRMELRKDKMKIKTTIVCPFYTSTGLFQGVKTRFPLLLPILKPEYVAGQIVKAIKKGRKRLIMPKFAYSIFLLRFFPVGFFDAVADFFGISSSMDDFTGRTHG
jgi:all-trans-retinol dehydrogenase (NAD+)